MKHKHHIIPKHLGGSDDESNLIELTIEEHAEEHRKLYEKYGNEKDKIAWLGLAKLASKSDIMKELHQLGRKISDQKMMEKHGVSNPGQLEHVRKMTSERNKKLHKEGKLKQVDWVGRKHKAETRQKMSASAKERLKDPKKNSQYGTCWITNGSENKKIKKEELDQYIKLGYRKGRIIAGLV